jgi:hypothetical protein
MTALYRSYAGTKRAAEKETDGPTTRSKVAKTSKASPKSKVSEKGSKVRINSTNFLYFTNMITQTAMSSSAFKSRALPLHVNLTHTPPVIGGDDTKDVAQLDPGFIGSTALVPSTFNTGSYGWKGNKRITVELLNSESGEKEKVQVMLT